MLLRTFWGWTPWDVLRCVPSSPRSREKYINWQMHFNGVIIWQTSEFYMNTVFCAIFAAFSKWRVKMWTGFISSDVFSPSHQIVADNSFVSEDRIKWRDQNVNVESTAAIDGKCILQVLCTGYIKVVPYTRRVKMEKKHPKSRSL